MKSLAVFLFAAALSAQNCPNNVLDDRTDQMKAAVIAGHGQGAYFEVNDCSWHPGKNPRDVKPALTEDQKDRVVLNSSIAYCQKNPGGTTWLYGARYIHGWYSYPCSGFLKQAKPLIDARRAQTVKPALPIYGTVESASFECLTLDENTLKDCKLKDGRTLTQALQVMYTALKQEQSGIAQERADWIDFLTHIQYVLDTKVRVK